MWPEAGEKKCRRRRRGSAGQSTIELAVIIPMLLGLMAGAFEMGRLMYLDMAVNSAARAGVQYGAQSSGTAADLAGMVQAAKDGAQDVSGSWWGGSSNFTAKAADFCQCADGTASDCEPGDCSGQKQFTFVKVDTSAQFNALTKFPGIPSSITVQGSASMRVAGE
ncbi:MAG: TadE/TadG family type IV pilus assembly protein [Candidatus Binataceae bacterium]